MTILIKKGTEVVRTVFVGARQTNVTSTYLAKILRITKGRFTYRVLATDVVGHNATKIGSATLVIKQKH